MTIPPAEPAKPFAPARPARLRAPRPAKAREVPHRRTPERTASSRVARFLAACSLALGLATLVPRTQATPAVILAIGAPGESEFGENFAEQAALWEKACLAAGATLKTFGLSPTNSTPPEVPDVQLLERELAATDKAGDDLWLVLVGHGTFDGRDARFNLRGPDLLASDLAKWLQPFRRRLAIVNAASASGPFLKALAAPDRVVMTATRTGNEINFTRFGLRFANTLVDPKSDLDQDGQISLLEAFLSASFQVAEFYKNEGRLATEHSLVDDNGDGLGTPADWFRGLRATKRPRDGSQVDGLRAHQMHLQRSPAEQELTDEVRALRDRLELEIGALRDKKPSLPEADYYARLEDLLRQLATLYFR